MVSFLKVETGLINPEEIVFVDTSMFESKLEIHLWTKHHKVFTLRGVPAIEALMQLKPSALEGRYRLRYQRHRWVLHNLVGHPLMQILSFFRLHKLALEVHDRTCPKPLPPSV